MTLMVSVVDWQEAVLPVSFVSALVDVLVVAVVTLAPSEIPPAPKVTEPPILQFAVATIGVAPASPEAAIALTPAKADAGIATAAAITSILRIMSLLLGS